MRFKDAGGNEFPNWKEKKLEEGCESLSSGKDKPDSSNMYPVYGSMGVIGYNSMFSYNCKAILIARVGANAGTINIAIGEYGVTDNTLIALLKPEMNINFVYYLLIYKNLNKLIFGSGQPLITAGQLKSLSMSFPSLSEQTKIAHFLSAIDKKIINEKKFLQQYENQKKYLLSTLFI
ncbi:MAG: restriction endonuclease subunit S [Ferruginibacter sp.]